MYLLCACNAKLFAQLPRVLLHFSFLCAFASSLRSVKTKAAGAATNYASFRQAPDLQGLKEKECVNCKSHDIAKLFRIHQIKKEILKKLGLSSVPNVTKGVLPNIPSINNMVKKFQMQNDGTTSYIKKDHIIPKTIIKYSQTGKFNTNTKDKSKYIYFKLSNEFKNYKIEKAYLWLWSKLQPKTHKHPIYVHVFYLEPRSKGNISTPVEKLLLGKKLHNKMGWNMFNIRDAVKVWIENPHLNMGIKIESYDRDGNFAVVAQPRSNKEKAYRPLLELEVKATSKNTRHKRSVCAEEGTKSSQCCKYPLRISFKEFGWDFIVAPTEIDVNYCSGSCSNVGILENNHAYLANLAQIPQGICCSATEMSPISLLYYNDNEIVQGVIHNLSVESCGCT